jgi:hypothetical protein
MNTNKEHIDDLFKDALSHHEETPPSYIWDSINKELNNKNKHKKQLLFWRSLSAAAVFVIIFLSSLVWENKFENSPSYSHSLNNFKTPRVIDNRTTDTIKTNSALFTKNTSTKKENQNAINNYTKTTTNQDKSFYKQSNSSLHKLKNKPAKIQSLHYGQALTPPTINSSMPANNNNQTFTSLASNNINPLPNESKAKKTGIEIGGHFTPTYSFRKFNNTSPQTTQAQTESEITTYSGGVNICFKRKSKWSIETGVFFARIGQNFSNTITNQSEYILNKAYTKNKTKNEESINTPGLQNSLGRIKLNHQINESENPIDAIAYQPGSNNNTTQTFTTLNLQQELDFLEIPFLLRYNLYTNNIKLSLSGGINTNLLVGNNAYLLSDSQKENIGETENINAMNYSTQFGIGLHAPIFKSISINIEPKIKYFINSVSKASEISYRPYSFGVYTGISYRFN